MVMQSMVPPEVQAILQEAESVPNQNIDPGSDGVGVLDGGYLDLDGQWFQDFEVRELTGRDEEYLGRVATPRRLLLELLDRGLVRVGPHRGPDAVDGLTIGDWECVLLAIRRATFGNEVELSSTCPSCRDTYEATLRLDQDVPHRRLSGPQDLSFEYKGRHGTEYTVWLTTGAVQRKVLRDDKLTGAEINTVVLEDCIRSIDGRPVIGKDHIRSMPLLDRRGILAEIDASMPGPRLEEVSTLCPSCGAQNFIKLNIAALFL